MKSAVRTRFIALAIVIFLSQTLLAIHAVSHIDKDKLQCQLCVNQAQQSHGLPVFVFCFTAIGGQDLLPDTVLPQVPDQNHTRPYYQRAPPFIA